MATYRFSITWQLDVTGRQLSVWTAPSKLRCGDLILLYEAGSGGGRKAFVAIGRAVTDALRSYAGDDAHWAWIEWRAVRKPLPLGEAKNAGQFSVMGRSGTVKPEVFDRIAQRLTATDPIALNALRRWRNRKGFPRTDEVPLRDLVLASLEAEANERTLYPLIRECLVHQGWADISDDIRSALRRLRGPLTFDREGDYGLRPDLLMSRPKSKRVLVVEVKRSAVRTQGYRNPVDQVLDYARAVANALSRAGLTGWTTEPLLVAQDFSQLVLDDAHVAARPRGVEKLQCRIWDGSKLKSP